MADRKQGFPHDRIVVGAERAPVLAFGQDLLRAADGAEIAAPAEGGRLLAVRQPLGGFSASA
ncbi:MAG TPA: hypothetical protein VF482_14005 [Trebonia sp.]